MRKSHSIWLTKFAARSATASLGSSSKGLGRLRSTSQCDHPYCYRGLAKEVADRQHPERGALTSNFEAPRWRSFESLLFRWRQYNCSCLKILNAPSNWPRGYFAGLHHGLQDKILGGCGRSCIRHIFRSLSNMSFRAVPLVSRSRTPGQSFYLMVSILLLTR